MQPSSPARIGIVRSLIGAAGILCLINAQALADEGEVDPPPAATAPASATPDTAQPSVPPASSDQPSPGKPSSPDAQPTAEQEPEQRQPLHLLDSEVAPGTTQRLSWLASESFTGLSVPTPVLVAHGSEPGPTLCLTAAVHGDELNGIEMVRRVLYGLKPDALNGTVIGVPIVNLLGFRRNSRYLPDRRDLNRYFPGEPGGSSASRIAYSFFESIVRHCDALVDLHTGSFHRSNLPQLRADLNNPEVLALTQGFGATAVLQNDGIKGTLRRATTEAGIPAVTLEAGEPKRFQPEEVAHGVKGIRTLLNKLGMVKHISLWGEPQPVYYEAHWVRSETGGILFSRVELGDRVSEGDVLGTVTDPITNKRSKITAPENGRILGMALNQAVIPGFAAYHMGIEKSSKEVSEQATAVKSGSEQAASVETPATRQQGKQPSEAPQTAQPGTESVTDKQAERPD